MSEDEFQLMFDFEEYHHDVSDDIEEFSVKKEVVTKEMPESVGENYEETKDKELTIKDIRRAVLGWIITEKPTGAALTVPTRISKYNADAAAFWSSPISINGKKYLAPVKTAVVEIRHNREMCWPDCSKKEVLIELLKEEKNRKYSIETRIRETEPELKIDDNLFAEYETWNYRKTNRKDYHSCLSKIDEIERSLYEGSRFERIRRAEVADYLYLAVPEGEVVESELADGWGLLYVKSDFSVEIIKEPFDWNCPLEKKYHIIQNIAAASFKNTLFANGIRLVGDNDVKFTKVPRRRRK